MGGQGGKVTTTTNPPSVGGSGSGGAIYLKAPNLVIQTGVKISANGGNGANGITGNGANSSDGGEAGAAAGGGGRIYLRPAILWLTMPAPLIQTSLLLVGRVPEQGMVRMERLRSFVLKSVP